MAFDNGVRLSVEMQDHQEPNMDLVPRADMPKWLKAKIAHENKQDVEQEEHSDVGSEIKKEVAEAPLVESSSRLDNVKSPGTEGGVSARGSAAGAGAASV